MLGYSHICDLFFPVRLLTIGATSKVETVETIEKPGFITLAPSIHVQERVVKLPQLSRLSETLATAADTVVAGAFWSHAELLQIPKESKGSWPKALQRTSLGRLSLYLVYAKKDCGLGSGYSAS